MITRTEDTSQGIKEAYKRSSSGCWSIAAKRFMRLRSSFIASCVLLAIILAAIFATVISPFDPFQQNRRDGLSKGLPVGPNDKYLLGTDGFGRDMLSRLLFGARVTLTMSLLASDIFVTFGMLYGSIASLLGGHMDTLMMRLVKQVLSPTGTAARPIDLCDNRRASLWRQALPRDLSRLTVINWLDNPLTRTLDMNDILCHPVQCVRDFWSKRLVACTDNMINIGLHPHGCAVLEITA